MSDKERDDVDPADWLASQFGAEEETPTDATPQVTPEPSAPVPPAPPAAPVPPVVPAAPSAPPAPPVFPSEPAAPPAPPAPSAGAPFQWGLTPGEEVPAAPEPPVVQPEPTAPPVEPVAPPVEPTPPPVVPPAAPVGIPDPLVIPQSTLPAYEPPVAEPADVPTQAYTFPGQEVEQRPWDPWQAQPVDSSLDGLTEVIEAEIVGLEGPEGESNPTPTPSMDDLFDDGSFRDYEGETGAPPPPPPPTGGPKPPRAPLPRVQKILLWVAGGFVALLALVALFLLGQRLASNAPAPALTPSPSPTASAVPTAGPLPAGPVAPGEYQWDELLGGECLGAFETAWQDRYTVVDCATPHPAQMVFRGLFPDDATVAYPGVEELTKRINLLCTAPTVINYQIAGTAADIQVTASFAATAEEWDAGDRTYYCFVNRASGENLTASVAVPPAQ